MGSPFEIRGKCHKLNLAEGTGEILRIRVEYYEQDVQKGSEVLLLLKDWISFRDGYTSIPNFGIEKGTRQETYETW